MNETLLGYVPIDDGLLDRYRQADVFLHVSWTEGFPQVLLEAFASRTPAVATEVGGVRGGPRRGRRAPRGGGHRTTPTRRRRRHPSPRRRRRARRERLVATGLELARHQTKDAVISRFADGGGGGFLRRLERSHLERSPGDAAGTRAAVQRRAGLPPSS